MKASILLLGFALVGLVAQVGPADAETEIEAALASVEARVGYGASLGGQAENSVARISPLSLTLRGSWLVRNQPPVSAYASLSTELGDRNSVGAGVGATVPLGRFGRASAGAVAIVTPFRLAGPSVAIGSCIPAGSARPCLDLEATFFAFGGDLPAGTVVSQLQVVLALGFDVL